MYIGPAPKGTSVPLSGTGTGNGTTVDFSMGFTATSDMIVIVTLDGVVQHTSAYSISGSTCTFSAAPANGVAIEFRTLQSLGFVAEVGDGAVNQNKIDTASLNPIVQVQYTSTGESITLSTSIPNDDTIPQISEGVEILTLNITPKSATNILLIEAVAVITQTSATANTLALFKDSNADAIAATQCFGTTTFRIPTAIQHKIVAGSTSQITFSVRGGPFSGTSYVNSDASGGRLLGGVYNTYLKITEIAQ